MLYHLTEYGALLRSVVMFFLFEKWEVFRTYLNFIWGLFFPSKERSDSAFASVCERARVRVFGSLCRGSRRWVVLGVALKD